jgi:hypothetical protein
MALRREHLPVLIFLVATASVLSALGASAWFVLLDQGWLVVALLAAALGWGAWPAKWLGFVPQGLGRWGCVAVALGLGLLSTITLALGMFGVLTRVAAWGLVAAGWAAGLSAVAPASCRCSTAGTEPGRYTGGQRPPYVIRCAVLLTLAFPVAVMLFGATLPPGVLWEGEARGYDVLEYHLQAPREFFEHGRIEFLPHNVYASFPQQMEMLYLLLMHLAGGPLLGAIPAQLLHATCGILAVLALAAWSPPGYPRWVVVATAGSVPWLAYLGCLAYVELGMVFFAAVAGGIVLDCVGQTPDAEGRRYAPATAAGICAGLAAGCKYTSLVLVVAALGLAWLVTLRGDMRIRVWRLALFGIGALLALSPWLVRNAVFTGNPVYPFGYRWLGGAAWSAAQDAQWAQGHSLPAEKNTVVGRTRVAWDELFAARMFGPLVFVLALAGLGLARDRAAATALLWFALAVIGWAIWTQMPGRFVVPVVVPLAMLGSRGVAALLRRPRGADATSAVVAGVGLGGPTLQRVVAGVVLAGAVLNNMTLGQVWQKHSRWWSGHGVPLSVLPGATEEFAREQPLNRALPPDAVVWLVGEARVFYLLPYVHYAVVFSRDPWLTYAETATPEQTVAWLRTQKVTHVVFCQSEIARLRASYGFSPVVTPAWVESLAAAGLRRLDVPDLAVADVDVYAVTPN